MSLLGKLFARGLAGNDDVIIRPNRKFTTKDLRAIAERGATEFRNINLNVLSCYGPLEGEFGVYETLSNFIQTKNALTDEITEAVNNGDEVSLIQAFQRAMELALVTLIEKGALKRLLLVDQWPAEAIAEYERTRRSVITTKVAPASPAPVSAPVAPVETPIETCVREFRELPSSAWKAKWLNDQRNRPVADKAVSEGRI